MTKDRYHVSLYILVPLIFTGISILAVIGTYWLSLREPSPSGEISEHLWLWGAGVAIFTSLCGLLIAYLILKPVKEFVREAENLSILTGSKPPGESKKSGDDIEHFATVFEQVKDFLSKAEARKLFPNIVGQSEIMRSLFHSILRVAPTDSTVLITGESGTGKELIANAIVEHSPRKDKPFVKINCVAIPDGLLESELFGHEKGAFTGATSMKMGKFELANGGTIFLDEIGDMPPATQAKLLRVLQEREFERVGGSHTIKIDVRIIAASNRNLLKMVQNGLFREDLYFRLNVFPLEVPPLRNRKEDIPLLTEHFLSRAPNPPKLSPEARELLLVYFWPGNVRELQNTVERASVLADDVIMPCHLPVQIAGRLSVNSTGSEELGVRAGISLDERLLDIEKGMIIEALKKSGGIQVKAAQLLGISPRSLWHRVKKHGIDTGALKKLQSL